MRSTLSLAAAASMVMLSGCSIFKSITDWAYSTGEKMPVYKERCENTYTCFGGNNQQPQQGQPQQAPAPSAAQPYGQQQPYGQPQAYEQPQAYGQPYGQYGQQPQMQPMQQPDNNPISQGRTSRGLASYEPTEKMPPSPLPDEVMEMSNRMTGAAPTPEDDFTPDPRDLLMMQQQMQGGQQGGQQGQYMGQQVPMPDGYVPPQYYGNGDGPVQ